MILSFNNYNRIIGLFFFIAATLHYPIAFYFIDGLYIGLYCLGIIPLLLAGLSRGVFKKIKNFYFSCYVAVILITSSLSFLVVPPTNVLKAMVGYLFFHIYFFLYINCVGIRGMLSIVKVNTLIAFSGGFLALYQIVFDPLLFGLYSNSKYEDAESWSVLRASSIFYSSQVYAAYMIMSIVAYDIYLSKRKLFDGMLISTLIFFGFFSGSVGFVLGVILYFGVRMLMLAPVKFLKFSMIVLTSFYLITNVMISSDFIGKQSPIYRVATFYDSTGDSSSANDERFRIWNQVINSNELILFGNGVGSASSSVRGEGLITTESYFLNLYYEGGLILLMAFLFLLVQAIISFKKEILHFQVAFLVLFTFYAAIVHVFYAVNLPIVWLVLFGFTTHSNVIVLNDFNIRR